MKKIGKVVRVAVLGGSALSLYSVKKYGFYADVQIDPNFKIQNIHLADGVTGMVERLKRNE